MYLSLCVVSLCLLTEHGFRRNAPSGHVMDRLLGKTWGRPAGIKAGQDRDPLSEATGLKAQPGIGQIEYSIPYGAKSDRPQANCNVHAKTFEATS